MAIYSTNVRNSSWNLANILIYPAVFLAATPFFINRLGENVFGEWMLINSYVYIAVHLVGFGLPVSIMAHVAEALGRNDSQKLHAYINASSRLLGRMTALTTLAGFALIAAWWSGWQLFSDENWKAVILATFLIASKFPEVLYQSIFKGQEQYHKSAIFNMLNRFITLAAHIFLVMKGYSLAALFLASLVVNLAVLIPQAVLIYRPLTDYKPVLFRSLPEKKEIYQYGFWTWLQTVTAIVSYQLDRFLVAYFLGTATVTYYVLASTIVNHLHMAFEAVVSWLLPRVSRLKAATLDTRAYFHTVRAFSVGFSLAVILGLFLVSEPLFTLWLGAEKYSKMAEFFRLFLIFEGFLILAIVPKYYLNAIKALHFVTFLEVLYKSGIIAGMLGLFYIFRSAESLVYGQIIALIIFMPVEFYLINRKILKDRMFKETILTSAPSLFIAWAILSAQWYSSVIAIVLALTLFYMVYIRDDYFDLKIFKE